MEARIPFSGFYESMWSGGIDREEEQIAEHLAAEHDVPDSEVANLIYQNSRYGVAHEHISKEYADSFVSFINEELGLSLQFEFVEMTSPKYYNFETDKIFIKVSYKDMLLLARRVGRNALRKAAKDMFTSRDGFISHYRNDITEWGPLRTWDYNQLYCLFQAAVDVIGEEDYDWRIYEEMSEGNIFSAAVDKSMDYNAVMLGVGKLAGKKELLEEFAESDDGKCFPTTWKDTADYVRRYHELNSKRI